MPTNSCMYTCKLWFKAQVCKKTNQESIVVEILLMELCGFGHVYVEFIGNCVDF